MENIPNYHQSEEISILRKDVESMHIKIAILNKLLQEEVEDYREKFKEEDNE